MHAGTAGSRRREMSVRLRQAVWAAAQLGPVVERLRDELGAGEPYADPGVAGFGLHNAVCALGDTFLEVISPIAAGTAAGRYLDRRGGDGGYMLIFQLDDLRAARARAAALGIRAVWQIDLPDISATHLHPADLHGTIVSLDRPEPPGSWRWAGPAWTGRAGTGPSGRLAGAIIRTRDPAGAAARWAEVLGVPCDGQRLALEQGEVLFEPVDADEPEGLAGVTVALATPARGALEIGGVRVQILEVP